MIQIHNAADNVNFTLGLKHPHNSSPTTSLQRKTRCLGIDLKLCSSTSTSKEKRTYRVPIISQVAGIIHNACASSGNHPKASYADIAVAIPITLKAHDGSSPAGPSSKAGVAAGSGFKQGSNWYIKTVRQGMTFVLSTSTYSSIIVLRDCFTASLLVLRMHLTTSPSNAVRRQLSVITGIS